MSNRQYFKAEALKHRHTVLRKLLILMPVICVALAAFLTCIFAVDGYNWWYMGMYPGFVALVCGTICEKEKKMKNRAILALPCDMGRVWDAKVLYGILMSGAAMLLLVLLVLAVAFILEHVLNVTFIIRPSLFSPTGGRSASLAVLLLADSVVSVIIADARKDSYAFGSFCFI